MEVFNCENEQQKTDDNYEISNYIENCSDPHDATIQKYLDIIKEKVERCDTVLVVPISNLIKDERYIYQRQDVYKIIDRTNLNEALVVVKEIESERNINLYKEKVKKMFCASDLYNMDTSISITLLPKMIEQFRDTTHGYPIGLTAKRWDKILLKLIWFFNETLTRHEREELNQHYGQNSTKVKAYNNKIVECQRLLSKYFLDLWD